MGIRSRQLGCSSIAIFLSGSVVWADVTADQVWADFRTYLESMGYTVEGTEETVRGSVTVNDLTLVMAVDEQSGTARVQMDSITFTETGDGRVNVVLPDRMPTAFTTTLPDEPDEDVQGVIDYSHSGFEMVVSGDLDNMVYNYSADELTFEMSSLTVGGEPVEIDQARMQFTDMSGNSTTTGADIRNIAQTMTIAAMSYVLDMASPDEASERISVDGRLENLGFEGTITLPKDIDMTDMAAAMRAGFSVDGGYTYENGTSDFSVIGEGQTFEGSTSSDSGRLTVRMDDKSLHYAGEARGIAMNYAGSDIPLPVSLTMGTVGFNFLFPAGQTDEPTDFGLGLTLADVTVSDAIWAMIDPAEQLPREPATVELDLTGQARLTQDIMDQQAMMDNAGAPPGEIHSLSVNALTLAIAGARLTGTGAFTFDNDDLTTFPGMPKPTGAVDFYLTGGNALMDTLVAMGLLPQEQAMGARMMLGLFARPGDGPDSLTSRIEVNEEGQVLANGQRLR